MRKERKKNAGEGTQSGSFDRGCGCIISTPTRRGAWGDDRKIRGRYEISVRIVSIYVRSSYLQVPFKFLGVEGWFDRAVCY